MSRIIAVVNQKGGVGKTTSTINVGAGLAERGKKVLLIDLDPQASLTTALGCKGVLPTIYDTLRSDKKISDTVISHGKYFFVPSGIDLSGAELELSGVAGRECILKELLEEPELKYDFILIDCPPSLSLLTLNALVASNEIFIALQTEFLAMDGMNQLLNTIALVKKRLNPKLEIKGIIATQYDARKGLHKEVYDTIKEHFGNLVFNTPIRSTIALAEASGFGNDIFEYRAKSNGAKDYSDLVDEILT